uniref:SPIN-DOC-like zinc-finger domain-containing protein n=1 Tax=Schistocephalus solidus TaxID=70667 RepID=A0A0V0J4B0_SCHSO
MTEHQVIDFSACRLLAESCSGPADALPTDCRMQAKSGCDSADSGCDFDTELPTAAPELWKINSEVGPRGSLGGTNSASSPPSAGQSTYNFSSCSSEEKPFPNTHGAGTFDTYNLLESSPAPYKAPLPSALSSVTAGERAARGSPRVHGSHFFPPSEHKQSSGPSNSGETFCGAKFTTSLQDMYEGEMNFLTNGTFHFPRPGEAMSNQDSVTVASARRVTAKIQKRGTKQVAGKMMKIARAPSKESEPTALMKSTAAVDVQSPAASYKYLSWREKDRRRRFREEWKNLWLVVPYGSYEVMCLLCHKIMTQRKLDTIKRHTIRRHTELLSMSELERQRLYYELTAHRLHRLGDKTAREGHPTEECGEPNDLPFGGNFSPLAPMLRAPTMGHKLGSHCRQACGSRSRLSLTGSRPNIQKARALCQGTRGRSARIGHRIAGAPKVMSAPCQFSPRDSPGLSAFPCTPDVYPISQQKIPLGDETRLKQQHSDSQSHSGMQSQGTPPFESENNAQSALFPSQCDVPRKHQIRALIQPAVSNETPSLVDVRNTYIPTSRTVCEALAHPTKISDEEASATAPLPTTKLFNDSGPQPGTEMCRKLPFLTFLENAFLRRSLARGFEGAEMKLPIGIPSLDAFPPCPPDIARVMKCFMDLQKGLAVKPSSPYLPRPMMSAHPRPNSHKIELELPFVHQAAKGLASRFCNMAAPPSAVSNLAPVGRYAGRMPPSTTKPRRDQTPNTDSLIAELQTQGLLRPPKTPLTQVLNTKRSSPYWEREGFLERSKPSTRNTFASGCWRLQAEAATAFDPRAFHSLAQRSEPYSRADMVLEPTRIVGRQGSSHKPLAEGTVAQLPAVPEPPLNVNQPPSKNPLCCSLFGPSSENICLRSQLVSPTCIARLLQPMGSGQPSLLAPSQALSHPPASTETLKVDLSGGGGGGAQSNTEGTSLTERLNRLVTAWDIAAVDGRQIRS